MILPYMGRSMAGVNRTRPNKSGCGRGGNKLRHGAVYCTVAQLGANSCHAWHNGAVPRTCHA